MKAVALIIIGSGIAVHAAIRVYLLIASQSWPRVMGEVLESSTQHDHEMNLWPILRYKYVVGGCEYVGSRIYAGGMSGFYGWYQWVYKLIDQHPIGTQISIYYDPRKPKRSCIKKEGWGSAIGLLVIGLGLFLAGLKLFQG